MLAVIYHNANYHISKKQCNGFLKEQLLLRLVLTLYRKQCLFVFHFSGCTFNWDLNLSYERFLETLYYWRTFCCFFEMKLKKNKQKKKYKRYQVNLFVLGGSYVSLFYFEFTCIANIGKNTFSLRSLFVYSIKSLSTHMKDFAECCGMVPLFLNPIWSLYIFTFHAERFSKEQPLLLVHFFIWYFITWKITSYINGQDITLRQQKFHPK